MSPSQHESMINSGLPPMSTFRGGQPTTSSYSSTSPTVNGSEMIRNPTTSQTGDALGKALASVSVEICGVSQYISYKTANFSKLKNKKFMKSIHA